MKPHTRQNTIRTLEKVRDEYQSQLDTSIVTELNTLIADLQNVDDDAPDATQLMNLSFRVLQVFSIVISLVSNLKDLMK